VPRVAILGWGSLLWSPGNLRNERKWRSDGPWLPIEFARSSNLKEKNGRRPYLSLVIYPEAGLVRTYWDMSLLTEIADARFDLQSREGCVIADVACSPKSYPARSSAIPGLEGRIQEWLDSKRSDVDSVIWTNLGWKLSGATRFTAEEGMKWLRDLREAKKDDTAEEYIRKAPSQTDTCLRRQAREEFGWSDIAIGY
jgi:hypothetical protein